MLICKTKDKVVAETTFINERLMNAVSHDRIAGYLRSSMFEIAGEQIEYMNGKVRIVCNSDIDARDVETVKWHNWPFVNHGAVENDHGGRL